MGNLGGALPNQPEEGTPQNFVSVYLPSLREGRVWQGEILQNLTQLKPTIESLSAELEMTPVVHELVIVMSQDCDLLQDYKRRQSQQEGTLPNILFCDLFSADVLRAKVRDVERLGSADWKKITHNQNERFQYLQKITPQEDLQGEGLAPLAVDFRIYFTLPTDEIYHRVGGEARRRARLNTPYVEHLAHRFYKFQSRVALPLDHIVEANPSPG